MIFKKHSVAVTKEDVEKDEIFSTVNIFTFFFFSPGILFFSYFSGWKERINSHQSDGKGRGTLAVGHSDSTPWRRTEKRRQREKNPANFLIGNKERVKFRRPG